MRLDAGLMGRLAADEALWRDFNDICDCGGRLSGTESEKRAFALLRERVRAASPANSGRSIPVPYNGWQAKSATLKLPGGSFAPCHPLVRTIATPPSGLTAEVIDLGRGTPDEFEAHKAEIAGRIVLVRHELMFAAGTIHRRRKYDMARANGAVGFLIAGPLAGHVVAGSSGRDTGEGIPALGISPETAAKLARRSTGFPTVTIAIETAEGPAETETLVYDYPGQTDEWVVLSAHVDGHDLAESAMDNGTGLAAVLAVARALSPEVAKWRRGLRVMFFSVEEWALTGSAQYVKALGEAERAKIALNVNLDSVAGSPNLAALTSGYAGVEPFLLGVAEANGQSLRTVRPLMTNSDHANFAAGGIPAIRLVAGFDDPNAHLRVVLTPADTRDKVAQSELRQATLLTAALVAAACTVDPAEAARWRMA
ncbi:M28 family peptidase [Reyranella sp. MMS21-HV4-11]|uniref:Carboxypeptidase Q n=1 Tax=Reyranella humidisoli TaxID=2849149 RepID=A0ABS6IRM5_9HYPH|nr:M28 family peptidase [Reyranella sp. MMS21-HV4-11]MBU8877244.1 M28 family peptidase [Reyranella sp. MMS21-HV4-11]